MSRTVNGTGRGKITRRRTCGPCGVWYKLRSFLAPLQFACGAVQRRAPTTRTRTSRGWRRSSRRRRTWCFWASRASSSRWGLRSRTFYHVMAPEDGAPARYVCVADVCVHSPKPARRRERLGAGARVLHSPPTFAAGAAAALGEALRGAGVPTPHAALRHADVTLSPRRPRSRGQR